MEMPVVPEGKNWDGHYPIVGLKIVKEFKRPDAALVERFRGRFVPDIADWLGILYTVRGGLKPAYDSMPQLLGPAYTVRVPPGDNLMVNFAIHMAKPGDVIVIDAGGHDEWCLGGAGMAVMAKSHGVAGMLIDGAYRDIAQVEAIEFPLIYKGPAAAVGPKRGPGLINVPVHIGGVIVNPGDIVVGDAEGTVVVPRDAAAAIAAKIDSVPFNQRSEEWDWSGDWAEKAAADKDRMDYFRQILEHRGCTFEPSAD